MNKAGPDISGSWAGPVNSAAFALGRPIVDDRLAWTIDRLVAIDHEPRGRGLCGCV
jgi:hypothetical protein